MAVEKSQDVTNPENINQGSRKTLPISEAILIAVGSACAYLFAFYYERGYSSFFGIPTQFINISLINILIFGAISIAFLLSSFIIINGVFPFLRPQHPYLAFYVPRFFIILFLLVIIPFNLFGLERWWIWTIGLVLLSIFAFLYLILPLIIHRKKGGWAERYTAELEGESRTDSNLFGFIGSRLGISNLGLIVGLSVMCTQLAGYAGEAEAMRQKEFMITNTTPPMVVLRMYGDNMICAPFDRNTHEVKKSFSIRKIAEDPAMLMNLESVGPLKPVEKLATETATPAPSPAPTPEATTRPTPVQNETPVMEPQPSIAPNSNNK